MQKGLDLTPEQSRSEYIAVVAKPLSERLLMNGKLLEAF